VRGARQETTARRRSGDAARASSQKRFGACVCCGSQHVAAASGAGVTRARDVPSGRGALMRTPSISSAANPRSVARSSDAGYVIRRRSVVGQAAEAAGQSHEGQRPGARTTARIRTQLRSPDDVPRRPLSGRCGQHFVVGAMFVEAGRCFRDLAGGIPTPYRGPSRSWRGSRCASRER